jgi:hypothetical protein
VDFISYVSLIPISVVMMTMVAVIIAMPVVVAIVRIRSVIAIGVIPIITRIANPNSDRNPERQNAARERKPIHSPPMQLREAFSYNFPFLFLVLLGMEAPAEDFLDALKMRVSL